MRTVSKVVLGVCLVGLGGLGIASYSDKKDKEIAALRAQIKSGSPTKEPASLGAVQPTPAEPEPSDEQIHAKVAALKEDPIMRLVKQASTMPLGAVLQASERPESKKVTYAHLKKNADRYFGTAWRSSGRVVEISEQNGLTLARVAIGFDAEDIMFVLLRGETDFVQYSAVDIIGYLAGTYSYESQAGWKITIPQLIATAMVKHGTLRKMLGKRPAPSDEE